MYLTSFSSSDLHQLKFWPWATIQNTETLLRVFKMWEDATAAARPPASIVQMQAAQAKASDLKWALELARYNFLTSLGSCLRMLKRLRAVYPTIDAACTAAPHMFAEGKNMRDMIEHADDYRTNSPAAQKPKKFTRPVPGVLDMIPGSEPGIMSATAIALDEKGHWIGGQLLVETVLAELKMILEAAAKVQPP